MNASNVVWSTSVTSEASAAAPVHASATPMRSNADTVARKQSVIPAGVLAGGRPQDLGESSVHNASRHGSTTHREHTRTTVTTVSPGHT